MSENIKIQKHFNYIKLRKHYLYMTFEDNESIIFPLKFSHI